MSAASDLIAIMPNAPSGMAEDMGDLILAACVDHGIDTIRRRAAFLASIAVETGQLRYLAEIWGPTPQQVRYDPPGSLANALGNTHIGDGKLYRGRGLLMITGRYMYQKASDALGQDLVGTPDLVCNDYTVAAATAGWFWDLHNLNAIADTGDMRAVTIAINGGTTGLADRQGFYDRAMEVLPI